jgi:hypothetical protein
MGFSNSIIGGAAALIRAAIRSPNYVAGSAGWSINKDGSAEFNSLTIRGTFQGTDFIINPNGLFFYAPSEALGNLALAFCPVATTGPFGESVPSGVTVGKATDAAQIELALSAGGQAAQVKFPVPSISLSNIPNMSAGVVSGTPNYSDLVISGPALATVGQKDWTQIALFSNNNSGPAQISIRYIDTSGNVTVLAQADSTGWLFNLGITLAAGAFITNDTWHAMPAFNAGFSHGTPAPAYKLYPDNTVALAGQVSATSGTTSGTVVTLPSAAYFPALAKTFALPFAGGTPATTSNCRLGVSTAGALNLASGPTGAAFTFNLDGIRYPLDS